MVDKNLCAGDQQIVILLLKWKYGLEFQQFITNHLYFCPNQVLPNEID